jgi:hypothetical protein
MQQITCRHFFVFLLVMSCWHSQAQSGTDQKNQSLKSRIDSRNYGFKAMSATSKNGRTVQLTTGYGMNLMRDSLQVDLPYYGRAYTSSYPASGDMGIRFNSQDFSYVADSTKNGGWDITIKPKGKNVSAIYLSISSSGYCTVRISSSDRDPISYYGTIAGHMTH